MTAVSLLKCRSYSSELIKEKIIKGLKDIDFDLNTFNNSRVALKPNLLYGVQAEKAVITHPEFLRAVIEIVKDYGGIPVLVESPAVTPLAKVLKKVGYQDIIDKEGVEVADVRGTEILHNKKGRKYKRFEISRAFFDVDIILNLPKLKTHGITYITAAVKNLFGSIPGTKKSQWHMRVDSNVEFSEFLLDLYGGFLNGFEPPRKLIHIMDAIVGLEGEGPGTGGNPREIGAIVIGNDAIAVDYVSANLVGFDVKKIQTIVSGEQRGLGKASFDEISLMGDNLEEMKIADFIPTRASVITDIWSRWPLNSNVLKNLFVQRPVPREDKCTLCYECKKICPADAIDKSDKKKKIPKYNYNKCIRCYCCMEICPEAAIVLKKGKLQGLLGN